MDSDENSVKQKALEQVDYKKSIEGVELAYEMCIRGAHGQNVNPHLSEYVKACLIIGFNTQYYYLFGISDEIEHQTLSSLNQKILYWNTTVVGKAGKLFV